MGLINGEPMTLFEHTCIRTDGITPSQAELNRMSEQGWELVTVNSQASQCQTYCVAYCVTYWKRPKEQA